MIKNPYKARFIVPVALSKFSTTAEPTLEGLAGTDYLGNAVADTGQAINVMDGYPNRHLTVTTNHAASPVGTDAWYIAATLNKRENFDCVMLDRVNLLQCYQAALSGSIAIVSHTSDAVGSATAVTVSKRHSGLLGKGRPHLNFDGSNDYVTKSNDADLNFGANTDFSIEALIKADTQSALAEIIMKGDSGGGTKRYEFYLAANGTIIASVDDDANPAFQISSSTVDDGEWHHIAATFDRDGNIQIYIDGAADGTAVSMAVVGDIDDATKPLAIGISSADLSSSPFDGDIALIRIWNRAITAAEVLTLYGYWTHTPIPTVNQWGSQTALSSSNLENRGAPYGYDSIANATATGIDGVKTGTTNSAFLGTADEVAFENDKKYGVYFDLVLNSGTAPKVAIASSLSGANISDEEDQQSAAGANYFEFTADQTTTGVLMWYNGAAQVANFEITNFKIYQIGCVAEYSHDGISDDQNLLLDTSSNNLHGTISGCEYIDCPVDGSEGFYYEEFTAVADRLYWFFKFNTDADTALADAEIGQIILGKIYEFQLLAEGGFEPIPAYPGIAQQETDAGRVQTEEYYGRRDSWTLNYKQMTEAEFEDYQEMLDYCKESLYPLYVIFNNDDNEPIVNRIRLTGPPDVGYSKGAANPWTVSQTIKEDL